MNATFRPTFQNRPVLTSQTTEFTTSSDVDATVSAAIASGQPLYRLDTALLAELRPDVILTQDLCDVCSIDLETVRRVAADMKNQPQVVSLNPETFEGVLDDVFTVGEAVGLIEEAESLLVKLRERFYRTAEAVPAFLEGPSVAFLEWTDPIFVGGHWTPQLIERAGGRHPLNPTRPIEGVGSGYAAQLDQRVAGKSIRVASEQLVQSRPEFVVVCPLRAGSGRNTQGSGGDRESIVVARPAGGAAWSRRARGWQPDVQSARAATGGCVRVVGWLVE